MNDYNAVVDNIGSFLGAVDQTRNDEVESLASSYAQLCKEANDRLRRCSDCLRRGMRSEAIHLAESQPVLLDLVATLDLPEREEWENLCASYDLPRPPRLLMEAAAELNEAYALEQPIESLLARHRLLALVRAPLADRVAVLRAIADSDAANHWWDDDLRTYEKARIVEARAEANLAFKARDSNRVNRLAAELAAPGWRIDVPTDLRGSVERSALAMRHEASVVRLRAMLPVLEVAYNAMDFDEANGLLDAWAEVAGADGGVPIPPDLAHHVAPVEGWVTDERARRASLLSFQRACGQLGQAIDRDAPNAELLTHLRTVEAFGLPIPAELVRRHRTLVESRELMRRRKLGLRVAAIAAGVLLCAGAVGVLIHRNIEERHAGQWAKTIGAYVEAGQYDKANGAWDEMVVQAPQFKTRAELVALKVQADDAIAAEQRRRDEFRLNMDAAVKAGVDRPDTQALASAEKVAATAGEKLEVLDLREKVVARRREKQDAIDDAFRAKVKGLAETVGAMEADVLAGRTDTVDARLNKAEADASTLELTEGLTANARQGLSPAIARMREVRKRLGQTTAEAAELAKVLSASPADLATALTAYSTKFPDAGRAPAFRRAAQDDPVWKAVLAYERLVAQWKALAPDSAETIAARQAALDKYVAAYPQSPFLPPIEAYRSYLKQASVATAADGPWKGSLRAMMNSPLMRLNQVAMPDGKRYFAVGDGKIGDGKLRAVSVILTNDVSKDRRLSIPPGIEVHITPSSQRLASDDVQQLIESFHGGEWETFGITVLEALRKRPDMDPVLAAILCARIVRGAEAGGWGLSPELSHSAETLESLGADDVAWMDPDDKIAAEVRPKADAAVRKLLQGTALAAFRADERLKRDSLFRGIEFRTVGTGILMMEGGRWQVRAATAAATDGATAAAFAASSTGAPERLVVARFRGTDWTVDPALAARVPEGSMVFFEQSLSPAASAVRVPTHAGTPPVRTAPIAGTVDPKTK